MRPRWWIAGLLLAVVVAVLFVPGLGAYIEGTLLGWMAGWAG